MMVMKMNKVRFIIRTLSLIFMLILITEKLLFGQRDFYIPKALIIPMHDQKHQLHASIGLGGGYDLNCSYSFSNHFAIFSTGTWDIGSKKRKPIGYGGEYKIVKNDYAITCGLGYFKKGQIILFETYAGIGISKVKNHWNSIGNNENAEFTNANYWNFFYQLSVGKKNEEFELGVAGRLSYSIYNDMEFYDSYFNNSTMKSRYENLKILRVEPVVYFGFIIDKIAINLQAGLSIPLDNGRVKQVNTFVSQEEQILNTEIKNAYESGFFGRLSLQYNFSFDNI